jgi:hypothetical protein
MNTYFRPYPLTIVNVPNGGFIVKHEEEILGVADRREHLIEEMQNAIKLLDERAVQDQQEGCAKEAPEECLTADIPCPGKVADMLVRLAYQANRGSTNGTRAATANIMRSLFPSENMVTRRNAVRGAVAEGCTQVRELYKA